MLFILLLLVQLVIFALLAFFLRRVLTSHIHTASSHLEEITKETTRKLEESQKKLDEANQYYDSTLAKARDEAEATKKQLMQEGQTARDEAIRQGRVQSEAITKQAQKAAEVLTQEIHQKIDEAAINQAHELVAQLMQGRMKEDAHTAWVEELIKNGFDGLSRMNIEDGVKEINVVSAYPLKPEQKTTLQKKIKENLKRDVVLRETADPDLIAGLKITVGSIVVDGTLKFKIMEMARHASRSNA